MDFGWEASSGRESEGLAGLERAFPEALLCEVMEEEGARGRDPIPCLIAEGGLGLP